MSWRVFVVQDVLAFCMGGGSPRTYKVGSLFRRTGLPLGSAAAAAARRRAAILDVHAMLLLALLLSTCTAHEARAVEQPGAGKRCASNLLVGWRLTVLAHRAWGRVPQSSPLRLGFGAVLREVPFLRLLTCRRLALSKIALNPQPPSHLRLQPTHL